MGRDNPNQGAAAEDDIDEEPNTPPLPMKGFFKGNGIIVPITENKIVGFGVGSSKSKKKVEPEQMTPNPINKPKKTRRPRRDDVAPAPPPQEDTRAAEEPTQGNGAKLSKPSSKESEKTISYDLRAAADFDDPFATVKQPPEENDDSLSQISSLTPPSQTGEFMTEEELQMLMEEDELLLESLERLDKFLVENRDNIKSTDSTTTTLTRSRR